MQELIDCDIFQYCLHPTEREINFPLDVESLVKPIYTVSVFELCRAFHFLVKYYHIAPALFRRCWAGLVDMQQQYEWDGCLIHICACPEEQSYRLPERITTLPIPNPAALADLEPPCEDDSQRYWDQHPKLITRLRNFHVIELTEFRDQFQGQYDTIRWRATPPEINPELLPIPIAPANEYDIVLDTNNFLPLLNQLPLDGHLIEANQLSLPGRLSEHAIRRFKDVIRTGGLAGKLIIPLSVLEEAHHVANDPRPERFGQYDQARTVLRALSLDPDCPLWNIFAFEPLTQKTFGYLIHLFEHIKSKYMDRQQWPTFGDALIMAHALAHGCKIASNEWFEKQEWDIVKTVFPHLVLE